MNKNKKAKVKRIAKGEKVTWDTNGRQGSSIRTGVVRAFIPRGKSAHALLPKRPAVPKSYRGGVDINTMNDRYLVAIDHGVDGIRFQTPRSCSVKPV